MGSIYNMVFMETNTYTDCDIFGRIRLREMFKRIHLKVN